MLPDKMSRAQDELRIFAAKKSGLFPFISILLLR
jgi:hypothetical protein